MAVADLIDRHAGALSIKTSIVDVIETASREFLVKLNAILYSVNVL